MRSQIKNPRTVVLLFHLRRQLGLSPPAGGVQRLSAVLTSPLASFDRALGYYELARLRFDGLWNAETQSDARLGLNDLARGLTFAWEPELRSELLLYRGLVQLKLNHLEQAERDLLRVLMIGASHELRIFAHTGRALLALERGAVPEAREASTMAVELLRRSPKASPQVILGDFPLSDAERVVVGATLELGRRGSILGDTLEAVTCQRLAGVEFELKSPFTTIAFQLGRLCDEQLSDEIDPAILRP